MGADDFIDQALDDYMPVQDAPAHHSVDVDELYDGVGTSRDRVEAGEEVCSKAQDRVDVSVPGPSTAAALAEVKLAGPSKAPAVSVNREDRDSGKGKEVINLDALEEHVVFGGVYPDMDIIVVTPLASLPPPGAGFVPVSRPPPSVVYEPVILQAPARPRLPASSVMGVKFLLVPRSFSLLFLRLLLPLSMFLKLSLLG